MPPDDFLRLQIARTHTTLIEVLAAPRQLLLRTQLLRLGRLLILFPSSELLNELLVDLRVSSVII